MNGVCVKWIGWVDLETLSGKAKLLFDDHNAKVNEQSCGPNVNLTLKVIFSFFSALNINSGISQKAIVVPPALII